MTYYYLRCALILALVASTHGSGDPFKRVFELIGEMKHRAETDAKLAQSDYDQAQCHAAKVIEEKKNEIADGTALITELTGKIKDATASSSQKEVEIEQLKRDIAANEKATVDSTAHRESARTAYAKLKKELEQCISALGQAVQTLTAGTSLVTVVAHVRRALTNFSRQSDLSEDQLDVVHEFLDAPTISAAASLLQVKHNPFGDYAPQSTQIMGIMKQMLSTFTEDSSEAKSKDAEDEENFQELMATKTDEKNTLTNQLNTVSAQHGEIVGNLGGWTTDRRDTEKTLKSDEKILQDTTAQAKELASEWATNSRLRSEEIAGMNEAMRILKEISKVRSSSSSSFLQKSLSSSSSSSFSSSSSTKLRHYAFDLLKPYVRDSKDLRLATLAARIKMTSIEKVLYQIDKMIVVLRDEQKEDDKAKDECEQDLHNLKVSLRQTENKIDTLEAKKARKEDQIEDLIQRLKNNDNETIETNSNFETEQALRQTQQRTYKQERSMNFQTANLLAEAIAALQKFYKDNKKTVSLVEVEELGLGPDDDSSYSGRSNESRGVIGILKMLKEDMDKEVQIADENEKKAQDEFKTFRSDTGSMLDALNSEKVELNSRKAAVEFAKDTTQTKLSNAGTSHTSLSVAEKNTSEVECKWIEQAYDTRRTKRNGELEGLQKAKEFLGPRAHLDETVSIEK